MSSATTNNVNFINTTTVIRGDSVHVTNINTNDDASKPSTPAVPPHLRTEEQGAALRATLATTDDKPISKVQQRMRENYAKQNASPFRPVWHKTAAPSPKQPNRGGNRDAGSKNRAREVRVGDGAARGGVGAKNISDNIAAQRVSATANDGTFNTKVQVNVPVSNTHLIQKHARSDAALPKKPTLKSMIKEVSSDKPDRPRGKVSGADRELRRKEGRCFHCGSEMHQKSKCPELSAKEQNVEFAKPSANKHATTKPAVTKPTTKKTVTTNLYPSKHIVGSAGQAGSAYDHAVKYGAEGKHAQGTAQWGTFADQMEAHSAYVKTAAGWAERKQELAQMEESEKQNGGSIAPYNFNETFTKREKKEGEDEDEEKDW